MRKYKNLRELREAHGLTQGELGSHHIENGHGMPSLARRKKITEILNSVGAGLTIPDVVDLCRAHQPEGPDAEIETGLHPVPTNHHQDEA